MDWTVLSLSPNMSQVHLEAGGFGGSWLNDLRDLAFAVNRKTWHLELQHLEPCSYTANEMVFRISDGATFLLPSTAGC